MAPGQEKRNRKEAARVEQIRRDLLRSQPATRPLQNLVAVEQALAAQRIKESRRGNFLDTFKRWGSQATPVLSRATQGAGSAVQSASGAAWSAGATASSSAVNTIGDPGLILFIAGLMSFWFKGYINNPSLSITLATLFMFFSAFFIFKGKSLLPTTLFWVAYLFFGIRSPDQLLKVLLPVILVGLIAQAIFMKLLKEGTVGEGAAGAIVGVVPILFFFLDVGLLDYLVQLFHIPATGLLSNLLLFTPWWALLGIFTTKKENALISILKMVAIIYIFIMLTFGIVPQAYENSQSALPGPEQFLNAQQQTKALLPKTENPFVSNLACIFGGDYTNVESCVNKRQEDSELEGICTLQQLEPNTPAFEECIKKQREKKQREAVQVTGVNDPTIDKPTKAEFIVSTFFPSKSYYKKGDSKISYPIEFKITNPRKQAIRMEFSCFFMNATSNVSGKIEGAPIKGAPESFSTELITRTVICEADPEQDPQQEDLSGSYTLRYEATLQGLTTKSRLSRAFIGTKETAWKEEWIPKIMRTHFPGDSRFSKSPAEFARINFAFGNPLENPIIEGSSGVILSSTVENLGQGKITRIAEYKLNLADEHGERFTADTPKCLEDQNINPPEENFQKQVIHLPTCVVEIPSSLQKTPEYVYQEFTGEVRYDYVLKKEVPLEVQVIS